MELFYPHDFPCRINESSRASHCRSCERAPGYLREIEDLRAKLQFVIDRMELEDDCYTFPDGDTWYQTQTIEED